MNNNLDNKISNLNAVADLDSAVLHLYKNQTYFDIYSGSLIFFILITITLIILVSYIYTLINIQPIIDDWANQRCKPHIIPVAGFITKPDGMSAFDYTKQNFTYCTQNILSGITGNAVQPITFLTNILKNASDSMTGQIQSSRSMIHKVRSQFQDVTEEIMGRTMNFTIPLIQIIASFKDMLSKVQGTMTGGLFTLLGSYYTLKSLMGAIAQFIVTILIALAAMVAAFWAFPFTWGAAIANTTIFVAISIPFIIILKFMTDVLQVKTKYKIPRLKCFDEDTLLLMNDGTERKIKDVQLGDILYNENQITSIMKVATDGSIMYKLNDVIVSDTHFVLFKEKWIPLSKHPNAIKLDHYNKKQLYCLNVSQKKIDINGITFSDWDEYTEKDIRSISLLFNIRPTEFHSILDGGFKGNTLVEMNANGHKKEISDIQIGDVLKGNIYVYGIVKIDGSNLYNQYKYNLGDSVLIEGGPNLSIEKTGKNISTLNIYFPHKRPVSKDKVLYNLLTHTGNFYIQSILFSDYNAISDNLLNMVK
jgi:hypothetical protein